MANAAQCRLKRTPGDAICDFLASDPGDVTLEVYATVGTVAIDSASTYSGGPITFLSATRIKFTVVSGHTTLALAYDFTDTGSGAGTLKEVCAGNTVLDSLVASIPAESYVICA